MSGVVPPLPHCASVERRGGTTFGYPYAEDITEPRYAQFSSVHFMLSKVFGNLRAIFIILVRTLYFNPLALELDIYSLAHHLCKM